MRRRPIPSGQAPGVSPHPGPGKPWTCRGARRGLGKGMGKNTYWILELDSVYA